jgi:membrane protease YdiL (CAAX protease family)
VLTDVIFVRKDWAAITQEMRRDQRRILIAAGIVMLLATVGVFVTLSWQMGKGVESFVSEALSFGLFLAVPVWYAFRRRADGWQKAAVVYVLFLFVMLVNNWAIKRGLEDALVSSPRAREPWLYTSVSMLLIWLVPLWMMRTHPTEARSIGLRFEGVGRQVLHGSLGAAILVVHAWVTLHYAGLPLSLKPWPYVVFTLCYELSTQSLTEELFFRGFLFNYLCRIRRGQPWQAAILVSVLNVLVYVVKFRAPAGFHELFGYIFYVFVMAMVNATLYRRWGGILPGLVLNVLFSMGLMLR